MLSWKPICVCLIGSSKKVHLQEQKYHLDILMCASHSNTLKNSLYCPRVLDQAPLPSVVPGGQSSGLRRRRRHAPRNLCLVRFVLVVTVNRERCNAQIPMRHLKTLVSTVAVSKCRGVVQSVLVVAAPSSVVVLTASTQVEGDLAMKI